MNGARLGGPIALIVLGLALALAVADRLQGVDLGMIGWILTGAGVLWLLLELVVRRPRAQVTHESTNVAPGHTEREVRRDQL